MTDSLMHRIWTRASAARAQSDSGIALVTVILWVLAVSAIGSVVAVSGVIALQSTTSDRAAASAQGTTDAGVAEALAYIRSQAISVFTCTEPLNPTAGWDSTAGCTSSNKWVSPSTPQTVSGGAVATGCVSGVSCYQVWIGTLQQYQPAQGDQSQAGSIAAIPEILRIHSTGFSGAGPGARAITIDVSVTPAHFPIGVFGDGFTEHAAHSPATNESLFLLGDATFTKCPVTGIDLEYNIPAAVHASGTINYQNTGVCGLTRTDPTNPCTTADPYDQDSNGVALATGAPCYNYDQTDPQFSSVSSTIKAYPQTTYFDANSLADYGYQPGGLTPSEYTSLKEIAQSEGTYNDSDSTLTTTLANLVAAGVTNPVVYDDNGNYPAWGDFPSQFFRSPSTSAVPGDGGCTSYSLTIVTRGSGVTQLWNGNGDLVASVFVPDGTMKLGGNATVIGTLFANGIYFGGKGNFILDPCFVASPPSGVMDVTTYNYQGTNVGNVQ